MQEKLSTLMDWLSNSEHAKAMAEYLQRHYTQKCEMWASCHRLGFGINTNMFVEAFHKVFKYQCLKGKHNRRVDTCLLNLLKYDRDRSYTRLINLTKNKTPYRQREVNARHKRSMQMPFTNISRTDDDDVYLIKSQKGSEQYSITLANQVYIFLFIYFNFECL